MPNQQKKPRRTPEQVIADLQQKQKDAADAAKKKNAQLNAQIKDQRAKLTDKARKEDTHIKVVGGALSFEFFKHHPDLAPQFADWVNKSSEPPETKEKILSRCK